MMDAHVAVSGQTATDARPLPRRPRERVATIPFDLSAYAVEHTGPTSWSAQPDAEHLAAWVLESHDEPLYTGRTAALVELLPTDVPRVTRRAQHGVAALGHRERFVLASIDGGSSIETMLELLDLPTGEVLTVLGDLCARGIVAIDRG